MQLFHSTGLPLDHTSNMLHSTTVYEWKCGSCVDCFPLAHSHTSPVPSFLKIIRRCCRSCWPLCMVCSQPYWVTWKRGATEPQSWVLSGGTPPSGIFQAHALQYYNLWFLPTQGKLASRPQTRSTISVWHTGSKDHRCIVVLHRK